VSGADHDGTPGGESVGAQRVSLLAIARAWGRIGVVGFGGPPAHIALLRRLCVDEREWISADQFTEDVGVTNLLPGPASTQLAILSAWRLRGAAGALVGGGCFIAPGLAAIIGLAALFLGGTTPTWVAGLAAGLGAAVPAVALNAAWTLVPASWATRTGTRASRVRWATYAAVGAVTTVLAGPFVAVALVACGAGEVVARRTAGGPPPVRRAGLVGVATRALPLGGLGALCWVAFKVGALSFGGGFVIVPLMQHDAVTTYHWMTGGQFLNAVALGQVTPGPVMHTVAVVGYAASGVGGALLAAVVAFAPSFLLILVGARQLERLRGSAQVGAFLAGAGPAAVGAIAGSSVALGRELAHGWQLAVLGGCGLWLLGLRRGVVSTLAMAGIVGLALSLIGVPI
jgi:chromate transporter